jgi:cytosine/adenosine deaminase-related metal-dependent hydrolase
VIVVRPGKGEENIMCNICRRGFLRGTAAVGLSVLAATPPLTATGGSTLTRAPQGEYLLRDATVITMDPALGVLSRGSVHVRDGAIVAVGASIEAPMAEVLDGHGTIVLPGLIDTHFHTWQTLFRSFGGTTPKTAYFPSLHHFAAGIEPDDMYCATLLASVEAIHAGVTTIHDWCHNIRSRAHAEEDIRALRDAGIRALWSFGQAEDQRAAETIRLDDMKAIHAEWAAHSNGGLLRLGMAWRGMYRGGSWIPEPVFRKELDTARALGLPISTHTGTLEKSVGHIEKHFRAGLLGPDINIVHACSASPAEIEMVKESGCSISSLPMTEMLGGWGFPKLNEFIAAGIPTGLGIDTSVLGGATNMFKLLQFAMAACNVSRQDEFALTPEKALELGTIGAARVLGIDREVGSVTPGKRADVIMVRTDALAAAVVGDPYAQIVESALPETVDTVMVDGRILKRKGRLVAIDAAQVVTGARASSERVRTRMKFG